MSFFPQDAKKLRTRIRSYERALQVRGCDDGYGKRFLVGTMYLLLGEPEEAIGFYDWYLRKFPDDGVEPLNHVSWALALYRTGKQAAAEVKLREAAFENLHIWDWLRGGEMTPLDIWYSSSWDRPDYLLEAPSEYLNLWNEDELEWADRLSLSSEVSAMMEEALSIHRALKSVPAGTERNALVDRLCEMREKLRGQKLARH